MLLIEIILGVKVTMNIATLKRPCLWYFSRFVTRAITFRPPNTNIYDFRAIFGLSKFQVICSDFQKLTVKLFHCILTFQKKQHEVMAFQCTSLLLQNKSVPQNYKNFLKDFQRESARYMLIRLRLLVKVVFMDIILNVKVTVNIATTKNLCFGYFCRNIHI